MCMCGKADVLVTERQLAGRLGVSHARVHELASEPGFPAALGEVTASSPPFSSVPFWRWDDVKDWVHEREQSAALVG